MDFARYAITRPVNIWILVLICLFGGILAFFEICLLYTSDAADE